MNVVSLSLQKKERNASDLKPHQFWPLPLLCLTACSIYTSALIEPQKQKHTKQNIQK